MALTDIKVRTAKPTDKQYKLTDGSGMHLLVHPNGSKYWRLQYRFDGKQKMLALGVYPEITLADARARRDEARKLLANGVDPGDKKKNDKVNRVKHGPSKRWRSSGMAPIKSGLKIMPIEC
ncbi:phage integrase family protein [Klebsiella pneumoniae]|nr:phage integrase family protein [Klebsiella pneumoniae]SBF80041.1 phage integrase family protein [Klebsiella pneumoniae]SBF83200.1 phage integrase family protein [Klebsiella pneumoniae]SBF88535.1 phage integrase family protein [Klebsiella pneumoniae]SBF91444.1 phage integrase family protein [Klebsiella pneumoniae]